MLSSGDLSYELSRARTADLLSEAAARRLIRETRAARRQGAATPAWWRALRPRPAGRRTRAAAAPACC